VVVLRLSRFVFLRKSAVVVLVGLMMSLIACAPVVLKPVTEEARNPNGDFDGSWLVDIRKAAALQQGPGNWTFNCGGNAEQMQMIVSDSVARVQFAGKVHQTFVGVDGEFRFEIPIEEKAEADGTSDISIDRQQVTLIILGSLSEQSGLLVWGIAEFANDGCKSTLSMSLT